ncbi:PREDICTED: perforin-1-like [Cyprinodon variegatus]|uniref:perforin-1-like n=1 Tax=Cyprinodon variegatus TaxID=28743 RepID=UPI0007429BB0|nr:PREDICTED: perforin-1-like [Cyprinodon variegatus]
MANAWQFMLLFWMWIPLSLPSTVSFIGSPQQCEKARFVPGYNLGGEGFDIVKMERKGAYVIDVETWNLGNGTCKMYRNSYLKGVNQKVPVAVVDWRTLPKCNMKVSNTLYDSVESLVKDSSSSVTNDWKIGLNISLGNASASFSLGGSHSRVSKFGMAKSKEDRYSFARQSVDCNLYRYRINTAPPMSPDFVSAVNSLPPYSSINRSPYQNLINIFGTHYITQVYLGGEIAATTAFQTCKATMEGLSETEVSDCLWAEASASFANISDQTTMAKHCKEKKKKMNGSQSFGSKFNERITEVVGGDEFGIVLFNVDSEPDVFKSWLNSLKTTPDIVQYNLNPIHMILPDNNHKKNGLKREVEQYIMRNVVLKKCSESCQIGHRSSKRDPCACVCNSNQNIKSNCCPAGKGLATLKVYKLYAKKLYGDTWSETDGSVEVKYGDQLKRTKIILNNDNPSWPEKFDFGPIVINMQNKLKFSVYDEDTNWNSDLLGQCSFDLRRGLVKDTCTFYHGTFYFTYLVECAPSLGGKRCDEYISSPMDPSLTKAFYTRNSVLLGNAMKMW